MVSQSPILCVGAALWDIIARAEVGLTPGSDVPGRIARRPGGVALNVALALADLGQPAALLAAVGRDAPGDALIAEAMARGVDCSHIARYEDATDSYVAIEDKDGEVFAAVADCRGLERAGAAVLAPLRDGLVVASLIVVDGNLPEAALAEIARLAGGARLAIVPASPAKATALAAMLGGGGTTLYLNLAEAEAVCDRVFTDSRAAAVALCERGFGEVVVTDGAAAVTLANGDGLLSITPPPVETRGLTGAGDRFLAAHLAARADGLAPEPALRAALAAAARHISREVT